MSDNFQWTDELVKEFVCDLLWWKTDEPKPKDFSDGKYSSNKIMEKFKQSHNKKELFKTEDGVSIYEGDWAFYVEENNNFMIVSHSGITVKKPHKYFSTSQSANEYVLMNKPCLSLNDVFDILTGFENLSAEVLFPNYELKFKQLAQEKINTK